jgi:hypothetical protein
VQIRENSRRGLHSKFAHDVRVGQGAIRQSYRGHQIAVVLFVTFQAGVLRVCFLVSVRSLSIDCASEWYRSGGGAQIPVARSPGLQNFVRRALILLDSQ